METTQATMAPPETGLEIERAYIDVTQIEDTYAIPDNSRLRQQRFAELHQRLNNSGALIGRFTEEGKQQMADRELDFAAGYARQVNTLQALANRFGQELQLPGTKAKKEQPALMVLGDNAVASRQVAEYTDEQGRHVRSFLVNVGRAGVVN